MRTVAIAFLLSACVPADEPSAVREVAEAPLVVADGEEEDPVPAWLDSLSDAESDRLGDLLVELPDRLAAVDANDVEGREAVLDELRELGDSDLARKAVPPTFDTYRSAADCSTAYSYATTASDKMDLSEINAFRAEFASPTSNAWWTVWASTNGATQANYMQYYAGLARSSPSTYRPTALVYATGAVMRSSESYSWALYEENYWRGHAISTNWAAVRGTSWSAYIASLNAKSSLGSCS